MLCMFTTVIIDAENADDMVYNITYENNVQSIRNITR